MITASQLKNGTLFEYEGSIVQVISFQMHRKSQSASVMSINVVSITSTRSASSTQSASAS